jgi:hypothetical protein
MALARFNYQPGQYETCTDETLIPASPVLNTWYNFEIGDWKHAISDVVLKQGGIAIPASAYELAIDTKYTAREAGESGKTVYAKWRIVNATYDEIATTVSGNNFGTYIDNAKLDSRLDALEAFDAALDAGEVPYDNSASGLTADDVQAAIDEIDGKVDSLDADAIPYDNSVSGLTATDTQAAIDEIQGDASKIDYDNATSGLTATDVKGALDELSVVSLSGETIAYAPASITSDTTASFLVTAPPVSGTNVYECVAEIKLVRPGARSSTTNVYINFSALNNEVGSTSWSKIIGVLPGDLDTQRYIKLNPGLYRIFIDVSAGDNHTITVKYKWNKTSIKYA